MASTVGRVEIDLTIRKIEDRWMGDPLDKPEGRVDKSIVREESKYNFLTVKEALEKLNKLIQG